MAQIRNEIYDETGLVRVEFIEVESPTQEELIAQKEAQLLAMYEELKSLKGEQMKSNYLASLYFIAGFLTSFSLICQGTEPYINLAGVTLFFYLTFSLTEALEEL